jgi:hypothetical protein
VVARAETPHIASGLMRISRPWCEAMSQPAVNHMVHIIHHRHLSTHFLCYFYCHISCLLQLQSFKMSQINKDDYDLSKPISSTSGLRQGLTSYGDAHFSLFLRKVFIKALGYSEDALSRPIIGIINTYSVLNPCHANVPQLIEAAKRGVQLSGGLAVDFPTISLHESFSSPTSMFLRNLMSMDTEEMIKAQPLDACIMIGGLD